MSLHEEILTLAIEAKEITKEIIQIEEQSGFLLIAIMFEGNLTVLRNNIDAQILIEKSR